MLQRVDRKDSTNATAMCYTCRWRSDLSSNKIKKKKTDFKELKKKCGYPEKRHSRQRSVSQNVSEAAVWKYTIGRNYGGSF